MNAPIRVLSVLTLGAAVLVLSAGPALASEEAAAESAASGERMHPLVGIVVAVLLVAGVGALLGVLRVIFPGPAAAADAALVRLRTGRLLLTGILPLLGAALLGAAAEATGVEALGIVWGIVVGLPLLILVVVGAMAAVPHLGSHLLRPGKERSLLARAIAGALILGLALGPVTWAARPLAPIALLLLCGWFLGAGLGIVFRPPAAESDGRGGGLG